MSGHCSDEQCDCDDATSLPLPPPPPGAQLRLHQFEPPPPTALRFSATLGGAPLVFDFSPPPSPGVCVCTPLHPAATVTVASTEPLPGGDLEEDGVVGDAALSSLPVSEPERAQVDSFFRGLKTQVFVCASLTNLYLGSTAHEGAWELRYTGIPVVLLDSGEARARNKRRIQILLAERGSCFTLWQDTIDNLSSYREAGPAFHTMCLSSDHSTLVGLSFDCPQAAQQLWDHVERLTSCPENISLSGPGARGRGRKSPRKAPKPKPVPLPSKAHISQPCCFQHVTSVDRKDRDRYFSLQTLVPALAEIEKAKVAPNAS